MRFVPGFAGASHLGQVGFQNELNTLLPFWERWDSKSKFIEKCIKTLRFLPTKQKSICPESWNWVESDFYYDHFSGKLNKVGFCILLILEWNYTYCTCIILCVPCTVNKVYVISMLVLTEPVLHLVVPLAPI
jgi:hypothetical protein